VYTATGLRFTSHALAVIQLPHRHPKPRRICGRAGLPWALVGERDDAVAGGRGAEDPALGTAGAVPATVAARDGVVLRHQAQRSQRGGIHQNPLIARAVVGLQREFELAAGAHLDRLRRIVVARPVVAAGGARGGEEENGEGEAAHRQAMGWMVVSRPSGPHRTVTWNRAESAGGSASPGPL